MLAIQPDCYSKVHTPNCLCGQKRDQFALQMATIKNTPFEVFEAADMMCAERAARWRKEGFFDGRRPAQEKEPA